MPAMHTKPSFEPHLPVLQQQHVHLWLLDTEALTHAQLDAKRALLNTEEEDRAQRFKRGQREFIAARILVRRALGYYTQSDPSRIRFSHTAHGKPLLADSNLAFNLSHSGTQVLLAVGLQPHLGVDIEVGKPLTDMLAIAERFYHESEYRWLAQQPETQQHTNFYRLWTLKEAFFKALGTGIAAGLHKAHFSLDQHPNPITAQFAPDLQQEPSAWQFHQAQLPGNYSCALAVASHNPVTPIWLNALELAF